MLLRTGITETVQHGKVPYELYGRGGTDSPEAVYLIIEEKRLSPYAQDKQGIKLTLNGLFRLTYEHSLKDLLYTSSPFLTRLPRFKEYPGSLYNIPVKLNL